jgi:hypothetical protein
MKTEKVVVSLQQVEVERIDYSKYAGKEVKIGSVETFENKSNKNLFLKLTTTVIDVIKKGKEQKELRATRLFNLFVDKDGKVGWTKDSDLDKYMQYKKVKSPEELLGKTVKVELEIQESGQTFLKFI